MSVVVEHRRERRLEADDDALVQMINPFSPERTRARIVNRSTGGLCIASLTFLARGAEVQVLVSGSQLFGKIRYCVPAKEGFRAGVALATNILASLRETP